MVRGGVGVVGGVVGELEEGGERGVKWVGEVEVWCARWSGYGLLQGG